MFELTGVTFVGMRRLRYNKPQSMLVTRIPAPPGAQANRQVITARFTKGWAGLPRAPDSPGVSSSGSSQGNGGCDLDSVAYELWLDNGA
ncbi:hypothetical protein Q1695_003562 [Nippostrongylus brasiliensis]|nr:hypothetical protein Q1695_003562 [Nippostrongylus brasiliensis]